MSHIEIKKTKNNNYASFVKKIVFMRESYIIKKSMGLQSPTLNKENSY